MNIEQSAQDGCIVLTLIGGLDIVVAPEVQRALLRCLSEQPDSVICDLSKLASLDPACATVFAAVAHRPASRWSDSSMLLCCAQPAVADVLNRKLAPYFLPVYTTLDQAIAHSRSRPPFLRECLRIVPTLEAIDTARWCGESPWPSASSTATPDRGWRSCDGWRTTGEFVPSPIAVGWCGAPSSTPPEIHPFRVMPASPVMRSYGPRTAECGVDDCRR